jgi:hypothetical protein
MRTSLTTTLAVGFSLFAALPASGQSLVQVTAAAAPNSGYVTAFGYYMSPYSGTVDGGPTQRFNCVDFFHDINVGDSWQANVINLGSAISNLSSLALTRNGESGQHPATAAGYLDVLKIYEAAAWLTAQVPAVASSNGSETTAIQTAIWYLASEYGPATSTQPTHNYSQLTNQYWNGSSATGLLVNNGITSTGYWVDQARLFADNNTYNASYFGQFNILAPTGGFGQEFIYSTPEPATLTLMGTGLLTLGSLTYRRRRRGEDVDPQLS